MKTQNVSIPKVPLFAWESTYEAFYANSKICVNMFTTFMNNIA